MTGALTVRADSGFYTHDIVTGACVQQRCPLLHHRPPAPKTQELIEAIQEEDWMPIPYWMEGVAAVAETTYTPFRGEPDTAPVRLIVRRVRPTPGSQLALFASYSYHAFITDREGDTLELEADHRRHAEIENAIRDLKYGVGLNHLPSGRFAANAAWLAVQVLAHNLARWTSRIGLGEQVVTTRTLRRRFFALVGRLTRSARRLILHLPQRWPWGTQFGGALTRLRSLPLPVRPARPGPPQLAPARPARVPCRLRTLPWVLRTPAGDSQVTYWRNQLPVIRPARRAPVPSCPATAQSQRASVDSG